MAAIDDGPDQFEVARQRAKQQNTAAVQGQQDALKRRFASLGSINSGAAIKQGQLAEEAGQQNLAATTENINSAQRAEGLRVKELQDNRDFSRSERLGGQEFAGSQADLGRKFQTGERLGGQDFAGQQAAINRQFSTSERLGGQDFTAGQQSKAQDFATGERLGGQAFAKDQNDQGREFQKAMAQNDMDFKKQVAASSNDQFAQQMVLANKQYEMDAETTAFNKAMAEDAAKPRSPLRTVLDPLGVVSGGPKDGVLASGGGAGGKIICTEYCRQGWITEEVLSGDLEYATKIPLETRANYLMWAQYVVPMMQRYPVLLYVMWPLTYNWVHFMAWKVGKYHRKPLFGPIVEWSCTIISNLVGKTIRKAKMRLKLSFNQGAF